MEEGNVSQQQSYNIVTETSDRRDLILSRSQGENDDFRNAQDDEKIHQKSGQVHAVSPGRWKVTKIVLFLVCVTLLVLAGIISINKLNSLSQKPLPSNVRKEGNENQLPVIEEKTIQTSPAQQPVRNLPNQPNYLKEPEKPNETSIAVKPAQQHINSDLKKYLQDKQFEHELQIFNSMIPDEPKQDRTLTDMYFFGVSIQQMILSSDVYLMYVNGIKIDNISLKQKIHAILRTQLVHSVTSSGQVQVELSHFDKSVEDKERAIRQILKQEEQYYEDTYNLSKYNGHQLRFCLVVTAFNSFNSRLYLRNLDSIFMQDYQNYHVVYIDNASPDKIGENVNRYLEIKRIPSDKIEVLINPESIKPLQNIYKAIHSHCPNGQIVGLINGNDSLVGRKVLQLYNAVYHQKKAALVYSNFLMIMTNSNAEIGFGFGKTIYPPEFESGSLRKNNALPGHHLMTFFSDLFKKIWRQDLCYHSGPFFYWAQDKAILTPMIEMAYPRVEYLAEITYEHHNDKGRNNQTDEWESVANIIKDRKQYSQINDFGFVDKAVDAGKIDGPK